MADTSSRVRLLFEGSERGVVAAATKSAAAIKLLNNQNTTVGKSFQFADRQATAFIGTVTKTAAVTSLVAAAGGAVGQAFAGALPIITALGVGSLTVKLGMDGIKKAAEGAKKPFEDLKKAVSGTFEKELKGPVQDVAGLLPKLTSGFQGVAKAISGAAGDITGFVSSARGVAVLNDVLAGTADFVSGLGPQLATFLDGFLSAVASAKTEMRGFGDAFGSIFGQLGTVLQTLANDEMSTFAKAIAGGAASLRGLGNVIASVVDVAIRLGAAFGDSFGVLLNGLADGIGKASPGLVDLGSALGDLFRAIAPLLPVIGELAGQFAHALADGIRAVIPYVQAFAAWAQNNIGTIKAVAEGIVALALGVKALSIFTSVVGWVDGVVGVLGRFTGSAKAAEGGVGRLSGAMGLLKGVAAAAALAAVAVAMDEINVKAAGGADKLGLFEGQLHNLVGAGKELVSGDFGGIFADINEDLTTMVQRMQSGQSALGQFFGYLKRQFAEKLPPLTFDINTGPAKAQLDGFIGTVNKNAPTVNINGNTNGAAFALQEIIREIGEGKGEVIIDGQPMKAQDALKFIIGLINNSNGEITINGQSRPAGDVLAEILKRTDSSTGTFQIDGNPVPGSNKVNQVVKFADGSTGTITVDGNRVPADGKVTGAVRFADGSTGTITVDGNQQLANGKINATVTYANGRTGTIQIDANTANANAAINGLVNNWNGRHINLIVTSTGSGGIASAGRLATGGPVYGPGTGTSDTAGLFALSRGEHVLPAREVKAAGGHSAIMAFRRSLSGSQVPRMTATRGRAASGGSVSSSGALSIPTPQVSVAVHIGNQEITDIVRTQIQTSNRQTRRTVGMGAGTTF